MIDWHGEAWQAMGWKVMADYITACGHGRHRRGSKHSAPPVVSRNGARGDEGTQGETMSETIGTMTSREACRVMARRMRHGGAGKQAQGK